VLVCCLFYCRLFSSIAAAATTAMMTTAAPMIRSVSVVMVAPGSVPAEGEAVGAVVVVGAIVGAIVCDGVEVNEGAIFASPTTIYVESSEL